jgi:hypothetical protein
MMAALADGTNDDDKMAEGLASANGLPANMMEKSDSEAEKTDIEPDNNSGNAAAGLVEDADEYPKGVQFFFVFVALLLSMFMVALDMVCYFLPTLTSDT